MEISEPPCYTLISNPSDIEPPNEIQLKWDLENGETESKIRALKKIIRYISNGDRLPGLLFPIIRYVLPSQDHVIKKLLLIFWEIVPKTAPDGNLLQEIILVCDAYRKDLEHPNEFVRGSTLRFLCKLKEPELLEPLMPAIRSCLKHKSSYVRRNAVLAIFTIYKNFPFLFPDATELIANFIEGEENMSCKRNAFLMLLHTDLESAFSYLLSCLDQVSSFGDILQLMVVQLINKVCRENPSERPRFIRCIYSLLNSNSPAVRYEAAGTLILSSAPTAIKAAASCYIDLIVKESDNNVKLIVLDRLISLKESPVHGKVLEDLVMHILRVLSSSDLEVKEKTLNLVLDLTTSRTVKDVTSVLKKEISKVHKIGDHEEDEKYLQLLVKALHSCCLQFTGIAADIIPPLMDYLVDAMELVSYDIIVFLREAVQKFEPLRNVILDKLVDIFSSLKYFQVYQVALWILGEYATSSTHIENILKQIKCSIGRIPILEEELKDKPNTIEEAYHKSQVNFVTPDGAYATQSFLAPISLKSETPNLKQYLLDGNFIIGVSLARALVKLALHYRVSGNTERNWNKFISDCMLIISCVMNFGKSNPQCASLDDLHHMLLCLKVLSEPNNNVNEIFLVHCRQAISNIFSIQDNENCSMDNLKRQPSFKNEVDDVVKFSQLSQLSILDIDPENTPQISLHQAVLGFTPVNKESNDVLSLGNLDRVVQLTGISDPVYAEAYVHSNQYNIVLDVFIVNQTDDLLQNCTLELATLGDLKLVEKPQPCVLAPHDFSNIKAVVKVSSTENGVIFGNIVYNLSGVASDNIVVLNDIRIDIKDYIVPTKCTDAEFRKMWAVFEWENKISVNTGINDLRKYLDYLLKSTNMKCLTPAKVLWGQCEFLSANLYARSIFGEDALVNVSLEKSIHSTKSTVTGHIRVRTKSQGMALYLGEMMNKVQKESAAIHTPV